MMIAHKGLRSFNICIWDAICVPFCVFNNKINGNKLSQYYVDGFNTSPNNMCIMGGAKINPEGNPPGLSGNNSCVLHFGNNNYEGQMAFGFGNNTIARRHKAGVANWSDWDYVALKSDLQSVISSLGTKSGNYDFNLLTQPGYYYVGNTDDAKNKPPYGGSGALVVYNIRSGSFIIQTFFAAHVFAMRYYVASSNTWLSWRGVRVDELA